MIYYFCKHLDVVFIALTIACDLMSFLDALLPLCKVVFSFLSVRSESIVLVQMQKSVLLCVCMCMCVAVVFNMQRIVALHPSQVPVLHDLHVECFKVISDYIRQVELTRIRLKNTFSHQQEL